MRIFSVSGLFLAMSFLLFAVQKSPVSNNCPETHWQVSVAMEDVPGPDNRYILPEISFIKYNRANLNQKFTGYYRFWTSLNLELPCDKK